jgi:hypothetical protein
VERVDTLVSFLILGEMVSVFSIKYDVDHRFAIYILYYVDIHSFYS